MTAAGETERFKNEPALTDFLKWLIELGERVLPERACATGGLTPGLGVGRHRHSQGARHRPA